jgi:phosphoribosylformylglycinamidine synthase subunit PurS
VTPVAKVVVEVMLKPEILDPQGQAIQRALPSLGFESVTAVRQGKRFEVEVADGDAVAVVEKIAATLLANPVIEDYTVRVLAEPEVDA